MIDTQKKPPVRLLPLWIAFARWKVDELQIVAVRILEVESLDASRCFVPIWNPLRAGGGMLYFMSAQLLVGLIHVAHDDSDVLEPLIVAARVHGNRPAFGREIFGQFDDFIA